MYFGSLNVDLFNVKVSHIFYYDNKITYRKNMRFYCKFSGHLYRFKLKYEIDDRPRHILKVQFYKNGGWS